MNKKGFSLLEVSLVILLTSILTIGMLTNMKTIEIARFNSLGQQVKMMLHAAQQKAHMEHKNVRVAHYIDYPSFQTELCVTAQARIYQVLRMPKDVKLYIGSKDYEVINDLGELAFFSDMSPTRGGTITLVHEKLRKKIQITVRPATGKLTLYAANIKK